MSTITVYPTIGARTTDAPLRWICGHFEYS